MRPPGATPLIGVTTYRQDTKWWAWDRDAALVPGGYLDLVAAAGAQPLLVPPAAESKVAIGHGSGRDQADGGLQRLVEVLDGLVLIGGGDVGSSHYGDDPDPRSGGTSEARDRLELELLSLALEADLPVLAICRGLQVLNVLLGGTLTQWLPDRVGGTGHQPRQGAFGPVSVTTVAGSAVRRVLGGQVDVLCSHHQAVATLGEGLVVTATSEDGVIEAVELPDHTFVVGVQWHPEETADGRLFDALAEAARERRTTTALAERPAKEATR